MNHCLKWNFNNAHHRLSFTFSTFLNDNLYNQIVSLYISFFELQNWIILSNYPDSFPKNIEISGQFVSRYYHYHQFQPSKIAYSWTLDAEADTRSQFSNVLSRLSRGTYYIYSPFLLNINSFRVSSFYTYFINLLLFATVNLVEKILYENCA